MIRVAFFGCLVALFFFITCCSVGRRAERICLSTDALELAREEGHSDVLFESSQWIPQEWWKLFNDDQLTQFIETAFVRNPTLQAARANILLAEAGAANVRASLFPYVWWGGDVSRQKLSETGVVPFDNETSVPVNPGNGLSRVPKYFTLYETQINLTYEWDIWGKNRNTLQAAIGQVLANKADEIFSRLQLGIALARVYFQLQIDYKREEIAKLKLDNRIRYQNLIQNRTQSLATQLTFNTSKENQSGALQALLALQSDIAVKEHQLKAYLADHFEEEICAVTIADKPLPKIPLPKELPLRLIAHRPDIISQLWLIESAGSMIKVAQAGFYPDFNLTAFFGFQTIHFRELFKWPSSYFYVDQAFTLPIFDAGRLLANLHGREISYDLAIFQYNDMVLNAVKEVLDSLAVLKNIEQQLQEYKNRLEYQTENLKLTFLRMTHHVASNIDYLESEESMLDAQDQEIIALGNAIQAILSLIKALGGGYDVCCCGD